MNRQHNPAHTHTHHIAKSCHVSTANKTKKNSYPYRINVKVCRSKRAVLKTICSFIYYIDTQRYRNCTYKVTMRRVRETLVRVRRNKYYTSRMCVCSLRYPACNAHAPILSSVACPALQYFPTLSHKRHDFRKEKLLNTKCVF